ncbi:MAG: ATP-binding domain-containing protein, partial [Clostridia bacterium]|nr:ATP-binding domain-containing protein [Clostridia bacterium]
DEQGEGDYIARTIKDAVRKGAKYSDMAVLYRMNAVSNAVERSLVRQGIPYRVFGGQRFYDRKEVKDVLAYLSLINNPTDDLRLMRIINEPKRGIGDTTIAAIRRIADETGVGMLEIICRCDEFAALSKRCEALKRFGNMIVSLRDEIGEGVPVSEVYGHLLERSGYLAMLQNSNDISDQTRLENVNELLSNIKKYEETAEEATLDGFLEDAALMTDTDNYDQSADTVVLMTIHGSKGLEFNTVFVAACEENIFPGRQSMMYPAEVEEERRLAYVAFTRARKKLVVSHAKSRMLFGFTTRNALSRFAADIPPELTEVERVKTASVSGMGYGGAPRPAQSFALPKRPGMASSPVNAYRPAAKSTQKYAPGMRVAHAKFGDGTVLTTSPMGADTLLEIAFDGCGTKKLMANFAGLKVL